MRVILSDAERSGRALTPVEQSDIARLKAQFDDIEAQISAADLDERASRALPQKTSPTPVGNWQGSMPGPVSTWGKNTAGFHSVGEYLGAIRSASGGAIDQRLLNAVTTYGGESLGPDGGFAVPSAWKQTIVELVIGKGTLIDHLNPMVTPSNMLSLPVDEGSAHSTSGITATWTPEAGTITASKPALKMVNCVVHKVAGLCHASDELLEDNANMNGYILGQLAKKIRFEVEDALVAGDGVAKPLGILAGPGKIVVDNATTVLDPKDIGNMVARLLPGTFESSFWLVHSTALPHLWNLAVGTTPVLVPDYTKSPYGTIMGRPVVVSESCSDYNTVGDIALVAPEGYALVVKSSGLRTDTTIAFGFDASLQSFRATMRLGGQPLLSAPVARKNGSTTLGHTIILDVRS